MYILNDNKYDFDVEKIEIRPITKVNNNFLKIPIKINIKEKKKPFLIQTPKMYLPFGINDQYQNKNIYLDISFRDAEYNPQIKKFRTLVKKIKCKLKNILKDKKIIKKNKNNLPEFLDSLKKNDYGERLTTKINMENKCILIYDNKKQRKKLEDIQKGLYTILILQVSDIWIKIDDKSNFLQYGINWLVMQVKIYEPLFLKDYCFIENSDDDCDIPDKEKNINIEKKQIAENEKIKNHPDYKMYFNMLKYGISKENIKYKMQLNNLNIEIIELDPDSEIPEKLKKINNNETNINNEILKGKTLKKTEKVIKKEKKGNVPTLEDILKGIKNLKNTNGTSYKGPTYDKNKYLNTNISVKNDVVKKVDNKLPINPMQSIFSEINKLRKY